MKIQQMIRLFSLLLCVSVIGTVGLLFSGCDSVSAQNNPNNGERDIENEILPDNEDILPPEETPPTTDTPPVVKPRSDWRFTIDGETVTLVGYDGKAENIVIPETYEGLAVTKIGDSAFLRHTNLISVVIPDTVTAIGDFAFFYCTNLTSIIIPENLTSIGHTVFYNCVNLTSINIPHGVESIGYSTFYGCVKLAKIYYGETDYSTFYSVFMKKINIGAYNTHFYNARPCFYSETELTDEQKKSKIIYWHYDTDGVPTPW
jgi:hypothetical protein